MPDLFKHLYVSIPNITNFRSLNITAGHDQSTVIATIICENTTFNLNDSISIDAGYTDDHGVVFQGRVKQITRDRADGEVKIICKDLLIDAVDFFIVSDDPEAPFSRSDILVQDLVRDLLNLAGIDTATKYTADVPLSFTYGVQAPAEFNLISAMDAINQLATMLAWKVYAEDDHIYFKDIQPYWRSGTEKDTQYGYGGNSNDPVSFAFCTDGSLTSGDISAAGYGTVTVKDDYLMVSRTYSDEQIRNKVVVYGREGIKAVATRTSPYLPAGFYKAAVISSQLIDTQSMADGAANFNVDLYNRLTDTSQIEVIGNRAYKPRRFCILGDSYCQLDIDPPSTPQGQRPFFIESVNHQFGINGYVTRMNLRR